MMWFFDHPYFFVLTMFVFVPTIVIWLTYWQYLRLYPQTFIYNTAFGLIWGLFFDVMASPLLKVWDYDHTLFTYRLIGLPLEEYIFLIFVPQLLTSLLLLLRRKLRNA